MLLIKYRILFLLLTVPAIFARCQILVSGRITDEDGVPLSFATVYEEGTTNGTTSNANGKYQLYLERGKKQLVAQYIGYERSISSVEIVDNPVELNFMLRPETLILKEVVISADDRDPAREIIRNTIRKRKFYEKEVNAYSCEVYVKGLQRLDKRPERLLGMTITIDTGIVYLSESISKLKFEQPDRINETMISSKVSGNNNAFSYNLASDMLINLYKNDFYLEGLSERSFISPIANNAFLYYKYRLVGTIIEDTMLINKIQIIPKRETDPVFNGYLYIIEGSWRLHSVDVFLTKENGIEFVDSLGFNQIFAPVDHDIWMPISQRFTFKFKVFGFEGSGYYTGIYKGYNIEPNYELFEKENQHQQVFEPGHEKKDLFDKKDFTNALLVVEEKANERDSTYWKEVRPIPLTPFEMKDYQIKDSIRVIKDSKPYKDSIDQVRNKFKIGNLALNGYTYFNSYKERYINFPTLIEGIQYNSVEGLVLNLDFTIEKKAKQRTVYQINPAIRYGFSNERFQAKVEALKMLDNRKNEVVFGGVGRFISQFNEADPIKSFDNTLFTLVEGNNYARFFQKTFLDVGYQKEFINGLRFTGLLTYAIREPMQNYADYNFPNKEFSPNIPTTREMADGTFNKHQALNWVLSLRIRFAQKYIDRPDKKINLKSPYPEINLVYKKGLPLLGSDVNYDLLKIGTMYSWRAGLVGESQISAWTGGFLNTKDLYFVDFEHFEGNQTYLRQFDGENLFHVLDYYEFSTKDKFIEAHYEHHFNEFIFNKIPFVKRLNLQAVASINYLTTKTAGNYFEFGGGIEHIFKFIRVDYFTAIRNGTYYGSGIRVGAGF